MNTVVLILDLDKLSKEAWSELFKGSGISVHRVEEKSIDRITDFLDEVQQNELDERNKNL